MQGYDVLVGFKAYASDLFEKFNGRQVQQIVRQAFSEEFDIEEMQQYGVICDHFPLHTKSKGVI